MIYLLQHWMVQHRKRPISVSPVCPWTGLDVQFWTCIILVVLLIQLGHSGCSGCIMLDVHALVDSRCSISLRSRFWVAFILTSIPSIPRQESRKLSSLPQAQLLRIQYHIPHAPSKEAIQSALDPIPKG